MNLKKMSRAKREALCHRKEDELQILLGNQYGRSEPSPKIKEIDDETLNMAICDTIGEFRFKKAASYALTVISVIISIFIILGIAGLLLFGIRQLI
jgi:hypothetical protein